MRTVKFSKTSREFTKREKLMFSDGNGANKLDEYLSQFVEGGTDFIIHPTGYAVLDIHNDDVKRDDGNKDYKALVIEVDNGNELFTTGSRTFMEKFIEIWDTMEGEDFSIKVMRKDSSNYKGKYFLTCTIV